MLLSANLRDKNEVLLKKIAPFGLSFIGGLLTQGYLLANNSDAVKTRPNIIFILADDWGYGDLGCFNAEVETPNLSKLISQGTFYTQFYVNSPVCSPSRASIITGHFPARHQIHAHIMGPEENAKREMPNWLDENLPVYLPRMLQEAGYLTAHFGKWHLGGGGLPNGDPTAPEPKEYGYNETRVWNGNGPTWKGDQFWSTPRWMLYDTVWAQNSSKLAVNATIDFFKRHKGEKPIFVNLWLKDPHTPLCPNEQQLKPYKNRGLVPEKETYYAVLTDADYHIGRLMEALTEMGLDKNTLVLFSSDNGPAHYEPGLTAGSTAGLKGRKYDIFQGGVNVPFIVHWPEHVAAGVVDSISVLSAVDLLPTFCELVHKELPEGYEPDGESFASIFENIPFKRTKPLFWDWRFSTVSENPQHATQWPENAVLMGDWKLYYNSDIDSTELYNIKKDRFERNNLSNKNPLKANELLMLLKNWKKSLPE